MAEPTLNLERIDKDAEILREKLEIGILPPKEESIFFDYQKLLSRYPAEEITIQENGRTYIRDNIETGAQVGENDTIFETLIDCSKKVKKKQSSIQEKMNCRWEKLDAENKKMAHSCKVKLKDAQLAKLASEKRQCESWLIAIQQVSKNILQKILA